MKNRGFEAALFFGAVGAFWRRWFGGGFGKAGLITRFWKYVVLVVFCAIMFRIKHPYSTFWLDFRTYAVTAAFAYHWARTHHDYYIVYSTAPDDGRIRWMDWILRKLYGEGNYYNFKGNVTGLFCAIRRRPASFVSLFLTGVLFLLGFLQLCLTLSRDG